jgi:hypothetical protein
MRANFSEMGKLLPQGADGRPDFAKMRELRDDENFQAQMNKLRESATSKTQELREETLRKVLKVLTKKQQTAYLKMRGEDFDLALLNRGGFGGRGPGGPAPGTAAPAAGATSASPKAATGSAPAAGSSSSPARKSLRERRGVGNGGN